MPGSESALGTTSCFVLGQGGGLGCYALLCGTHHIGTLHVVVRASGLEAFRAAVVKLPIIKVQASKWQGCFEQQKAFLCLCYSSQSADGFSCSYMLFVSVMNRVTSFPKAREKPYLWERNCVSPQASDTFLLKKILF